MSNEVSIETARKRLGDYVNAAMLTGTTTIITRNGRPAARIAPLEDTVPPLIDDDLFPAKLSDQPRSLTAIADKLREHLQDRVVEYDIPTVANRIIETRTTSAEEVSALLERHHVGADATYARWQWTPEPRPSRRDMEIVNGRGEHVDTVLNVDHAADAFLRIEELYRKGWKTLGALANIRDVVSFRVERRGGFTA